MRAVVAVAVAALATAIFAMTLAPRADAGEWLVLLAGSSLILAHARPTASVVLGGAAVLRIAALIAPVSLSDDVFRYAWDGALILDGIDPYAVLPIEVVGRAGLSAADLSLLNSPGYYTIYPPLAQAVFAAGVAIGRAAGD